MRFYFGKFLIRNQSYPNFLLVDEVKSECHSFFVSRPQSPLLFFCVSDGFPLFSLDFYGFIFYETMDFYVVSFYMKNGLPFVPKFPDHLVLLVEASVNSTKLPPVKAHVKNR